MQNSITADKKSFGLTDGQVAEIVKIISANLGVKEAVIFGSRAKGVFREGSDIDIALKGAQLCLTDLLGLMNDFDTSSILNQVDLVIYERIDNDYLRNHIDRLGKVIYTRT